jgi:hypothetical protein
MSQSRREIFSEIAPQDQVAHVWQAEQSPNRGPETVPDRASVTNVYRRDLRDGKIDKDSRSRDGQTYKSSLAPTLRASLP